MFDDREIRKQIKDSEKEKRINRVVRKRYEIDMQKQKMEEIAERSQDVQMLKLLMDSEDVRLYLALDKSNYLFDLDSQIILSEIDELSNNDCTHPLYIACEGGDKYSCTCAECGRSIFMNKNTDENIIVIDNSPINIPEIRSYYFGFKRDGYSLNEIKELLDKKYNNPKEKDKNLH